MDKLSTDRRHTSPCLYNGIMTREGNIYAYARMHQMDVHADRVCGSKDGLVLVVFTEEPASEARNALEKSFDAIGYDARSCAYAGLAGLEPGAVFELVEGIDPLVLVACDAQAAELCAQAARQPFPALQPTRLFGRDARAFAHLNEMLSTETDRQRVWHALKSLAR